MDARTPSDEEIQWFKRKGLEEGKDEVSRMKYTVSDTVIPQEARLFGKSLKLDILADVHVKLQSFSEENQGGRVV